MAFEEYWNRLVKNNAGLTDKSSTMKISVKAFKASLDKAFNSGNKHRSDLDQIGEKFSNIFDKFEDISKSG